MAETPLTVRGFQGLNLRESPGFIEDEDLLICQNFNLGRTGELVKRTGFSKLHDGNTLEGNVTLLGFYRSGGFEQLIVSAENGLFYSSDGGSWEEISSSVQGNFGVQYLERFYIISNDGVRSWDGTALSALIADSPPGTFGIVFKDRLFVMGDADNLSRLYFSDIADLESWPSINFLDIIPGEGDRLVTAAVIQDTLIIFKNLTVHTLNVQGPPANWVRRTANNETGCISNRGVKEINDFLFFIGPRGVWRTDGFEFTEISKNISPVFTSRVVNDDTINLDSTAEWENRFILLIHPQSTSTEFRYLVYQLETGGWTEWVTARGIHPSSFLEIDSPSLGRRLFAGDLGGSGSIFRYGENIFMDAGEEYDATFTTKEFDFNLPSIMKRGKWCGVDVTGTKDFVLQYTIDGVKPAPVVVSSEAGRKIYKIIGPGYFRTWSFKVTEVSNVPFNFHQLTLWMHRKTGVIRSAT